jgi:peptide deformylase
VIILKIYVYPEHDVLRRTCCPVEAVTDELRALLDNMVPFMREHDGVGLAAPQIGVDQRFFVVEYEGNVYKVVNPVIVDRGGGTSFRNEGCLSVPEMVVEVERYQSITVRFRDERGREREMSFSGMLARIFQHEYDHLEGRLIVDHIDFTEGMNS